MFPVSISVCPSADREGAGSQKGDRASAGKRSLAGMEPSRVPGPDSHLVSILERLRWAELQNSEPDLVNNLYSPLG